ncbi:MAG: hypothetical protein WKG07_09525 [Hymenobacter sp.]
MHGERAADGRLRGGPHAGRQRVNPAHSTPQKNTVYALAKEHFTGTIEAFGLALARHFVARNPQVSQARIEILEHAVQRMSFDGKNHPHAFTGGGSKSAAPWCAARPVGPAPCGPA